MYPIVEGMVKERESDKCPISTENNTPYPRKAYFISIFRTSSRLLSADTKEKYMNDLSY
jgi:hypothetical protein